MGHGHSHDHAPSGNVSAAFFLNAGFTVVEIIGGIYTGSFAILSDALHDAGDTASLGLAWYFQRLSKRGRTPDYTFGYRRFNTIGALITGVVLVAGSVLILTEAVPKLWAPGEPNAVGMIWLAVLGVLVNGAAVFKLSGGVSLNEKVLTWHLLEDVLGWAGVLIGSIVMYFYDVPWLDPAMSIAIACFILYGVVKQLLRVGRVITQSTPEGIDHDEVSKVLLGVAGVRDVHDLHLWTLDGDYHLGSAHVVLSAETTLAHAEEVKAATRKLTHDRFGLEHFTIETETAAGRAAHGEMMV